GFVNQSDGEVRIDSEPGKGAAFVLTLPPSDRPAQDRSAEAAPQALVGGSEQILVVEDDPSVLALTVEMLGGLGYRTLTATSAAEALEVIDNGAVVDLLFSDIVMPGGVSGVGLARAAQERRPDLKVLLTSGFVGDRQALEQAGYPVLDKPYQMQALAAKLRALLNGEETKRPRRRRGSATQAAAAG
ncbi:response regulator, partial [Phenylobacterium sp.]|uniref:response regulator n=1 Tax=Phenylobacterium sp. TaxID=1871053 RepID=UPI002E32F28D